MSTISISTCDSVKDSTRKFETPIYLQFSRPENGLNDQASDIQCAYYDTTYYRWLSLPMDNTNTNGSNVICQVDHLTYFSLLFRENDTNDDRALTILDGGEI